ncbi:unnamed protein product [Candidula unifasciata]|uniref:tRNA wybutosine-synthesizing protein 3 homolog n=1 Tax=Candidula unifasciata TaxID=100452 RepID=A0A8S4AC59_9EUPU|nr:unnamed protein product [Candidula unifasciata]
MISCGEFAKQKSDRLKHADLSRKGSVDEALHDVVNLINSMPMYFTTSSCSGRTIVVQNQNAENKIQKNGCKWLHVTHDKVQVVDIENAVEDLTGEAVFKFEPMVMHVQCQSLEDARRMHQAAVAAGFRNSGITVGTKGKIITAIRSTHSLEAPLSSEGKILVSNDYLKYLTASANRKLEENFARIHRFHELVKLFPEDQPGTQLNTKSRKKKRNSAKTERLAKTDQSAKTEQSESHPDVVISKTNSADNTTLDLDFSLSLFDQS